MTQFYKRLGTKMGTISVFRVLKVSCWGCKSFVFWWAQQDSNLRPADYDSVKNGLSCTLLTAPETTFFSC